MGRLKKHIHIFISRIQNHLVSNMVSSTIEEFFNQAPRPKNFEINKEAISSFVERTKNKKIVLITVSTNNPRFNAMLINILLIFYILYIQVNVKFRRLLVYNELL